MQGEWNPGTWQGGRGAWEEPGTGQGRGDHAGGSGGNRQGGAAAPGHAAAAMGAGGRARLFGVVELKASVHGMPHKVRPAGRQLQPDALVAVLQGG